MYEIYISVQYMSPYMTYLPLIDVKPQANAGSTHSHHTARTEGEGGGELSRD